MANSLLGLVLCGGESKRMGTDKGLLPAGDTIWAKRTGDKLIPFNIEVFYSINQPQLEMYSAYVDPARLIVDSVNVKGPLKGLLSGHRRYPVIDLLLLACDMSDLSTPTIENILHSYQEKAGYDAYVYQDEKFAQPFCGIYTANALSRILLKALSSSLLNYSMQSILNSLNTKRITIRDAGSFKNYNSPS